MPFIKVKSITGAEVQFERYLPADATAIVEGQVLAPTADGRVIPAGATTVPEFVAIQSMEAKTPQTEKCTLIRVQSNDEYEVKTNLTVPVTALGVKRTLSADGLTITDTTTGGIFLISATDGKTLSSTVRGYFKR